MIQSYIAAVIIISLIGTDSEPQHAGYTYTTFLSPARDYNEDFFQFNNEQFGAPAYHSDSFAINYGPSRGGGKNEEQFQNLGLFQSNENFGSSPAVKYGPNYFSQLNDDKCQQVIKCKPGKYRTLDGTCNNVKNPNWGAANTNYGRLLPAKYSDGIHAPPIGVTGQHLPSARLVSYVLFPDEKYNDPIWSLAAMQWGQIITHDMSFTALVDEQRTAASGCCGFENGEHTQASDLIENECLSIPIPQHDPFYSKYGQTCMKFIRTATDQDIGCPKHGKPAEQVSSVTHWMDASLVYGSSQQEADSLRAFKGGKLRVDYRQGREWPPQNPNKTLICSQQSYHQPCYLGGDARINQNPQLTIFQIHLLREHNRMAKELNEINPHWDDEKLYQESRRILIGMFQHISYYEWLPIFLGWDNLVRHGVIYESKHSYINDYNPHINPNTLNEHATGSFRYFHTNIQGHLNMYSEDRFKKDSIRLSDWINRPAFLEDKYNFDDLTRGMATQAQSKTDRFFTKEITTQIFKNNPKFGQDLRAIDIQRNRDHGLASYNEVRHFCGLRKAANFKDFDNIDAETVQKLEKLYSFPDDVDLIVGSNSEKHVPGTLAGPTNLCVMTEQFYRTRVADKHFFERGDHKGAFTPEQLNEIRKSNIARIMCDNSDNVSLMQPQGFRKISAQNKLTSCRDESAIPRVNLEAWKDTKGGGGGGGGHSYDFSNYFKK